MKTVETPTAPLTQDALRCLALFERFGRRRAGSWLRSSALAVLQDDPGFDLWKGIRELLRHGLLTGLEGGQRFALSADGAERLRSLTPARDGKPEPSAPRDRVDAAA